MKLSNQSVRFQIFVPEVLDIDFKLMEKNLKGTIYFYKYLWFLKCLNLYPACDDCYLVFLYNGMTLRLNISLKYSQ